jgi:hypothetical protein
MQKYEELVELLEGMGASFTGFSNVAGKLGGSLQNLHYAVTVGLRLSEAVIDDITDKPTYTYFHHYRTVNALLDQISLRGVLYIQQKGLQQITSGYNVTVKDVLPGMSVDELIIDVYVGVSENLL